MSAERISQSGSAANNLRTEILEELDGMEDEDLERCVTLIRSYTP